MDNDLQPFFEGNPADRLEGIQHPERLRILELMKNYLAEFKERSQVNKSSDPKVILESIVNRETKMALGLPGFLGFIAIYMVGIVLVENKIINDVDLIDIVTIPTLIAMPSWVMIVSGVILDRNINAKKYRQIVLTALDNASLGLEGMKKYQIEVFNFIIDFDKRFRNKS